MVRTGESSDDNYGIVEPRVGPSFQAEVPAFDGIRGAAGTGRHDDVLLWHPNAAAPEVVDVFLRSAEQAIGDPRLVGSVPELALEALYQAGGDPQRASDALTSLESRHAASLWSEEETAELQDSVTAHGTNLRRVHAGIANLSTRSFPECVSQHARSVEKRPLLTSSEPSAGGGRGEGRGGRSARRPVGQELYPPRAMEPKPLPKCPILSKCHPLVLNDPTYPILRPAQVLLDVLHTRS